MTDTTPLAALLVSHPEECAAVVAVLATCPRPLGLEVSDIKTEVKRYGVPTDEPLIRDILVAGRTDGALMDNSWGQWRVPASADRYAIARLGALPWLRSRCGPPASTNPLNLGTIRLCALASEGARRGAIFVAAWAVKVPFPTTRDQYRDRLTQVARLHEGLPVAPLDVEAEVTAAWGSGTP